MITEKNSRMEIMAPVGSMESLTAAIQGGADSVYFGVGPLNMRSRSAVCFGIGDLPGMMELCRTRSVKTYLTLNTIIYDREMGEMQDIADAAIEHGITAIIASDISVMEYCRKKNAEVHISTQCNITNTQAVRFYSRFADVMVLARELDLDQVSEIHRRILEENICGPSGRPVRLEVFAHGALCMAISGKCYLSLGLFNRSANRGACYQPCRRGYVVTDTEGEVELAVDHEYIMSPKDLCTLGFLDKIHQAGVSILKIEGRGRSADYVKTVTECYREAADALAEGSYHEKGRVDAWMQRLKTVYNRGFWDGYYLGRKTGEWAEKYGSQASVQKLFIGRVTNYFSKAGVAEILIDTHELNTGDEILITGPTTGVTQFPVQEIRTDGHPVEISIRGDLCSVPCKSLVRRGDKVYRLIPVAG